LSDDTFDAISPEVWVILLTNFLSYRKVKFMSRTWLLLLIFLLASFALFAASDGEAAALDAANDSKPTARLQALAEQGDPKAQNALGVSYSKSTGVAEDHTLAVQWFRKAAEQNYALAQYNLADSYYTGSGIKKDPALAIHWYRKAASKDMPQPSLTWELPTTMA
jgi:TPR repeat protein